MCYKNITVCLLIFSASISFLYGDTVIKDSAGYNIKCPDPQNVKRIFATSHAMSCVLYVLAPDKLCALNRAFGAEDYRYVGNAAKDKPVLGGWLGSGKPTNSEALLQLRPQIIFAPDYKRAGSGRKIQKIIKRYSIPLLYADINNLDKMPEAFIFIGKIIGEEKRAAELADMSKRFLAQIRKIKPNGLKVYYAAGENGLSSYSGRSPETEVIYLAGGINAIDIRFTKNARRKNNRRVSVNIENLISINPDVIIVNSPTTLSYILHNPAWRLLRAVKNNKVYLIPLHPVSWVNRPPSFPRLIGTLWLAHILNPAAVPGSELKKMTGLFYNCFYRCKLSKKDIDNLLSVNNHR